MPLHDYLSHDDDDRISEVTAFLSEHWTEVLDKEPVLGLRFDMDSPCWIGDRFEVEAVEVGTEIRARFSFHTKGFDEKSKPTGEEIEGSALAMIDEFDNVEFSEIEASQ